MNDIAYSINSPRVRKYAAYKRKEHNNAVRNFKKNCDYRRWMVGLKECNKMKTKEIYKNADRKCECWKCELKEQCVYRDRHQGLPREDGGLGKCAKLKENGGKLQY